MSDDCICREPPRRKGVLKTSFPEGAGLSLHCAHCGGWVDDAWLFTDGIPVTFTVDGSHDYTGEWMTYYELEPYNAL